MKTVGWGISLYEDSNVVLRLQFYIDGKAWQVVNEGTLETVDPEHPLEMASIYGHHPQAITARRYIRKEVSEFGLDEWLADAKERRASLLTNQPVLL